MASFSNIATNARSMNGIIILSDGFATIENGNITTDGSIISTNITTDDLSLNLGGGRSLSVLDDLSLKATYTDILSLSGVIYTNNNSVISYENATNNTINLINNELVTLSSLIYTNNNSVISYENATNNTINLINNELVTLSSLIYTNNDSVINYENSTNSTINLINNELFTVSSLIYTNNNSVIKYKNNNNLTINSISGNLVYLQNQINNCMDLGGYEFLNYIQLLLI